MRSQVRPNHPLHELFCKLVARRLIGDAQITDRETARHIAGLLTVNISYDWPPDQGLAAPPP